MKTKELRRQFDKEVKSKLPSGYHGDAIKAKYMVWLEEKLCQQQGEQAGKLTELDLPAPCMGCEYRNEVIEELSTPPKKDEQVGKIEIKEIESFLQVFHHEYGGKSWSVSNFLNGLKNWIKPKSTPPTEVSDDEQAGETTQLDLRQRFVEEEGIPVYNSDNEIDLDYVLWLERKLLSAPPTEVNKMKLMKDRPIEDPNNPQWDTDW